MKSGILIGFVGAVLAFATNAQQPQAQTALPTQPQQDGIQSEVFASEKPVIDWDDPEWWEYFARRERSEIQIPLGRPRYSMSGPVVETFRPQLRWSDRTPLEKITTLPIVSLFVPQPMPKPPTERGSYFKWGEREEPWSNLGDHGTGGPTSWLTISR